MKKICIAFVFATVFSANAMEKKETFGYVVVPEVFYNPNLKSIVATAYYAKNERYNDNERDINLGIAVTVIKYLGDEKLEVSASRNLLCHKKTGCFSEGSPSDYMLVRCVADPTIVQQLITKIAEFESGMTKK